MRIWIAVFLLSLFSLQALPVKEMGKILVKAKMSMEDKADDDENVGEGSKAKKEESAFKAYISPVSYSAELLSAKSEEQIVLHTADHLPVLYKGEVLTPPPNHC